MKSKRELVNPQCLSDGRRGWLSDQGYALMVPGGMVASMVGIGYATAMAHL